MNRRAGFTLIELLITITIMVTLITLAVVLLRNNQQSSRDEKRKSDVMAIAQQLESYYSSGSDPAGTYPPGEYPPTSFVNSLANIKLALRDIDTKSLWAPDADASGATSFTVATNTTTPSPNISAYVYMPLASDGSLCQNSSQECRKFTIFYTLESDTSTIQQVTSKVQ
jgi:prepilin-type N-terminal cleavage/methylation domain-containing protein